MRKGEKTGKIAIIGMSCLFPGAPDLSGFWSNIVRGVDAIRDVSDREWKLEDHYDPAARSFGKTYSKRGGFISEFAEFDPLKYGVMPSGVAGGDPDQFLTLRVAYEAMQDAGYLDKAFDRDRAEVILGRIGAPGAGSMNLIQQSKTVNEISELLHGVLANHDKTLADNVISELRDRLVVCNSDTIPGAMPNVLAGRIAAKLGFRGRNLLVDAACASSMVAVETAVQDLLSHQCDFALAGGLHVNASAVFFQMFCGLGALSRADVIRPFDEAADGTLLGEGIGIICLKRLEDAIADGDRIYATICGVASTSDGHGGSVLSPSLEGEALAMERAYKMADVSPTTVGLLEAHGTGTPTGDVVELQAIEKVFRAADKDKKSWCAVGSVKSMIGHCQSASAVAGIIKAALALHHKIIPPTLHVDKPNTKIDWRKHPCYINTQARPWIHDEAADSPRRAGVSAFGFGGINAHMVLEEVECAPLLRETKMSNRNDKLLPAVNTSLLRVWDSELFTFTAEKPEELLSALSRVQTYLQSSPVDLKDLAYSINKDQVKKDQVKKDEKRGSSSTYRLAIVCTGADELLQRLQYAETLVRSGKSTANEPDKGIYFTSPGTVLGGSVAFLYPGLGSAYTGMLADLCMHFPEVREVFDIVDTVATAGKSSILPSSMIFPRDSFSKTRGTDMLAAADFAVVAVLLAEYAMYHLLELLDVKPDALMGCSTGEFAAITTGGAVDVLSVAQTFYGLSTSVARAIPIEKLAELRSLRVFASAEKVMALVPNGDVHLSADLGEKHIIVTGPTKAVNVLSEQLSKNKMIFQALPIAIPYHTPLVKDLVDANSDAVKSVNIKPLAVPSWACSTGVQYPDDQEELRKMFTDLFTRPVSLRQTILSMYDSGVRKFIEVGPNGVLSSVVESILGDKPHLAIPSNLASRPALTQLHHLLAALYAQGVDPNFDFLYMRRAPVSIDWKSETKAQTRPVNKLSLRHTKLEVSPELKLEIESVQQPPAHEDPLPEPDVENRSHRRSEERRARRRERRSSQHDVEPVEFPSAEIGDDAADVVGTFLGTNSNFYNRMAAAQQRVMSAFFEGATGQEMPAEPAFLSRFQVTQTEFGIDVNLHVDLQNDLYLFDHAVGGQVSVAPPARAYLMPLMVSLEIMAEAAYVLNGPGVVARLEQVKAFKRIAVDHTGVDLNMRVSRKANSVHVEMFERPDLTNPILLADFVFATEYAPVQPSDGIAVAGEPPTNLVSQEQLYKPPAMFHGPRMQSVISLDTIGQKTIAGRAYSREATGWMPHLQSCNFLIHPLLLDNASQFVLFYLYERNLPAIALLPFFIEKVEFFYPSQMLPPVVTGRAVLHTLTEKATEAKVEVVDDNNSIWMRVTGINSKRITLSDEWLQFVSNPLAHTLGKRVAVNSEVEGRCVLTEFSHSSLPQDEAILDWCLDYVLTRNERAIWREKLKFEKRRLDWLVGRIAAKEAIRQLAKDRMQILLGPLDIEIHHDEKRRPVVSLSGGPHDILVSISHTDGIGMALASLARDGSPGIDSEQISSREADFGARFLKGEELRYLDRCPVEQKDQELTRLWSAKETAFKSLGGALEMTSFNVDVPTITKESIALTNPAHATTFRVFSDVEGDRVRSYTLATTR